MTKVIHFILYQDSFPDEHYHIPYHALAKKVKQALLLYKAGLGLRMLVTTRDQASYIF